MIAATRLVAEVVRSPTVPMLVALVAMSVSLDVIAAALVAISLSFDVMFEALVEMLEVLDVMPLLLELI